MQLIIFLHAKIDVFINIFCEIHQNILMLIIGFQILCLINHIYLNDSLLISKAMKTILKFYSTVVGFYFWFYF